MGMMNVTGRIAAYGIVRAWNLGAKLTAVFFLFLATFGLWGVLWLFVAAHLAYVWLLIIAKPVLIGVGIFLVMYTIAILCAPRDERDR